MIEIRRRNHPHALNGVLIQTTDKLGEIMLTDFGKVIQLEFISLIVIITLTIIPVNLNYLYIWDQKNLYVDIYFIVSVIIILTSNIFSFMILNQHRKLNIKYYLVGMAVFIGSLFPWITRKSSNLFNFAQLDSSGILPSIFFAAAIVTIQAFWYVTAFIIKK